MIEKNWFLSRDYKIYCLVMATRRPTFIPAPQRSQIKKRCFLFNKFDSHHQLLFIKWAFFAKTITLVITSCEYSDRSIQLIFFGEFLGQTGIRNVQITYALIELSRSHFLQGSLKNFTNSNNLLSQHKNSNTSGPIVVETWRQKTTHNSTGIRWACHE